MVFNFGSSNKQKTAAHAIVLCSIVITERWSDTQGRPEHHGRWHTWRDSWDHLLPSHTRQILVWMVELACLDCHGPGGQRALCTGTCNDYLPGQVLSTCDQLSSLHWQQSTPHLHMLLLKQQYPGLNPGFTASRGSAHIYTQRCERELMRQVS